MCDKFLPEEYPALFHEDNNAMIRVIKTGRNPTMRFLHRTRRISIAVLHEIVTGHDNLTKKVDIEYTHPPATWPQTSSRRALLT
eukprot:6409766-Lingulodinium_polyedra.AAC.1